MLIINIQTKINHDILYYIIHQNFYQLSVDNWFAELLAPLNNFSTSNSLQPKHFDQINRKNTVFSVLRQILHLQ